MKKASAKKGEYAVPAYEAPSARLMLGTTPEVTEEEYQRSASLLTPDPALMPNAS